MIKSIFFVFIILPFLFSCSLISGTPLEIISWSPSGDVDSPFELTEVQLVFNREPEAVCTKGAFSMTSEGAEVPGRTSVEGTTLAFIPYSQLEDNADYEVRLAASAEDFEGISLREDFRVRFRIGKPGERPSVNSVSPADGETTDNQETPVVLNFDTAVDFESVLSAFSITPAVTGVSVLDESMTVFTFTPAEKLEWQKEYKIIISTELESINGYALSDEFSSDFKIGSDETCPLISTAASGDGSVELLASSADGQNINVNTGWEKDWPVRLRFSEEVERQSAESAITVEPDIEFDIRFDEAASPPEMIITFDENLHWHELYRIAVSTGLSDLQDNRLDEEYICYIFVDGPSSSPPLLERVDLIPGSGSGICIFDSNTPGAAVSSHEILDTSGGDATEDPFFLDYYFSLAAGAELPFFGFIENFLISPADSCVSVNYLDFQIFNPGDSLAAAAAPVPTPNADQGVVRLITALTDDAEQSGMVLFQVYSDLSDSLGNLMQDDWTTEFFDEDS